MFKSFKTLFSLFAAFTLTAGSVFFAPAKISAASPAEDFEIGVACHGNNITAYSKNVEDYIHKAAQLGVSMIRIDMGSSSPAEIAYQDKVVALCEAYGLNLMAIVYDTASAETLGKRYGNRIKYWQMSNERDNEAIITGDGTSRDHYDINVIASSIGEIKGISAALRQYAPESKLLVNFTWTHYAFMDFVVEEQVDFDIVGYDWYSNMETYGFEKALTDIRDKYGKPILVCESNIWTLDHMDDPNQSEMAPYIKQCIELCLKLKESHNILGYTIYEFLNEPHKAKDQPGEAVFGLININENFSMGQPKAAYTELQQYFGGNPSLAKIPASSLDLDQFGSLTGDDDNSSDAGDSTDITAPNDEEPPAPSGSKPGYPDTPNNNNDNQTPNDTGVSENSQTVNQADPQIIQSVQTSHIYKEPGFPLWLIIEIAVCVLAAAGGAAYLIIDRRKAKTSAKK